MAKKIITQGAAYDKLRAGIVESLKTCKQREKKLTRAGVQIGRIHFKSDRPTSMYVLEPSDEGKRKYVHVGTDSVKQAVAQAEVARWAQRNELRGMMAELEAELRDLDRQITSLFRSAKVVHGHAGTVVKNYVEGKLK